jgi:hypothetical protein
MLLGCVEELILICKTVPSGQQPVKLITSPVMNFDLPETRNAINSPASSGALTFFLYHTFLFSMMITIEFIIQGSSVVLLYL